MMDETTALTGTTTITKEKKRYTPLVVFFTFSIALLLVGMAFHSAGQPIHDGTSLAAAAAAATGGGGTTRGASSAVAKKTTVTPTSMPTLQMFLQQYPVVNNRSSEEQAHLYMVYKLHLSGVKSDDLDMYKTNALNLFGCCIDSSTSPGCQVTYDPYSCGASSNAKPAGINTEPNSREGSITWPWTKCV